MGDSRESGGLEPLDEGSRYLSTHRLYLIRGFSRLFSSPSYQTVNGIRVKMGALGNLFPFLWFLAFLSPLAAIFFAVRFYAVHRRRRPERNRRLPVPVYVVILLVCAIISFPFGLFLGIRAACSGPAAGNLCGLFGFFVTGPFASSLTIFLVSGLIAALPADEPAMLSGGDVASVTADKVPRSPADEMAIAAKTGWSNAVARTIFARPVVLGFFHFGNTCWDDHRHESGAAVFARRRSGLPAFLLGLSDKCWRWRMAQRRCIPGAPRRWPRFHHVCRFDKGCQREDCRSFVGRHSRHSSASHPEHSRLAFSVATEEREDLRGLSSR